MGNKEKVIGILGIGKNHKKLVEDFLYMFSDRLNVGGTMTWEDACKGSRGKYDQYICCSYDRNGAKKKLSAIGMIYKRDYLFAEDYFALLDDWKGKRIAYSSYPRSPKGMVRAIIFGYAAKHGRLLPGNKYRDVLKGRYQKSGKNGLGKRAFWKKNKITRSMVYALYFLLGFIETWPQFFAKNKLYEKYDYICFESVSDAIRYINDHPSEKNKVVTTDELKTHTMASLYMRAVYYDRRQNPCFCDIPFQTIWIGENGRTRLCECPEYLDIGLGNAGVTEASKIWKSPLAEILRLSVINHSFTFCSRTLCGKLKDNADRKTLFDRLEVSREKEYPQNIIVANDRVCNLHCPSCRKTIHAKNNTNEKMVVAACTDDLIRSGWLEQADKLIIGANGETFLSNNYKRILYDGIVKRKSIVIMTNGTLFTPDVWEKINGKYSSISFMVSVDAATKETYEKVRCGGNYERLMENMRFLSDLRKEKKIDNVKVIMIVQRENYKEIPDFIRWAEDQGFDGVNLSHIRNWGTFSEEEFETKVSMFDRNGEMKPELAKILEDPICKDPIVVRKWEGNN